MPQGSQHKANDDDTVRESLRGEELANGEKGRNTSNGQCNEVGRRSNAARNSGAGYKRCKHDGSKPVQLVRCRDPHPSPTIGPGGPAFLPSISPFAVLGALVGTRRSSAASPLRSAATSMS